MLFKASRGRLNRSSQQKPFYLKVFLQILRKSQEKNYVGVSFNKVSGWRFATLFKERFRSRFFSLWMLRNFLKALLNRSNISSNKTKMPSWMKCSKKEKIMLDEEKWCWMKIWLRANFSSDIFRLIQHNFHVGMVCSLFHCNNCNEIASCNGRKFWRPCVLVEKS